MSSVRNRSRSKSPSSPSRGSTNATNRVRSRSRSPKAKPSVYDYPFILLCHQLLRYRRRHRLQQQNNYTNGHILKPNGHILKPNGHILKPNGHILKPNGHLNIMLAKKPARRNERMPKCIAKDVEPLTPNTRMSNSLTNHSSYTAIFHGK